MPCHIVITSRQDFRDWNYPQMEIYELNGEEEVMELFRAYNAVSYEEEEMEAVRDMIQYMDYHTMLTELLAKHLRVSGLSPREVKSGWKGNLASSGLAGRKCATARGRQVFKLRCRTICGSCLTPAAWDGRRSGFWRICLSLPERGWTGRCFWNGGEATPGDAEDLERLVLRGWVEEWEDKKVVPPPDRAGFGLWGVLQGEGGE